MDQDRSPRRFARPSALALAAAALLAWAPFSLPSASAQTFGQPYPQAQPQLPSQQAQPDIRSLLDRVSRLERALNDIEVQMNRGGVPPAQASGGGGGLSGGAYSTLDQRITALEGEIQDLTGQTEKAGHDVTVLSDRVDRMSKDTDLRLRTLENAGPQAGGGAVASANGLPPGGPAPSLGAGVPRGTAPQFNSAVPTLAPDAPEPSMGSAPHPLGQLSDQDLKNLAPTGPAQDQQTAANLLPGRTTTEKYNNAYSLLLKQPADYDGAALALQAFITQYPKDPLVPNAMFWLANTNYAQGRYDKAALGFRDVFSKYPKSAKGNESLLDLGMSMEKLNKSKDACIAFNAFLQEPGTDGALRAKAQAGKKRLACS